MKRVGIITIWQIENYGAELQAYALQKKINALGYLAENIDYPFYKNPDFRLTQRGRTGFEIGWKNRIKELLLPQLNRLRSFGSRVLLRQRQRNFREFYEMTARSAERYLSFDQLYDAPPVSYDIYMTGSDQVWNPRAAASIEPYFLTFAPAQARRITYASSFGVSSLPSETLPSYRRWLQALNSVSVREESAVALVQNIAGIKAKQVLDPTLLLSRQEWESIAGKQETERPYLLLYDLIISPETVSLARKIAKERKLHIVRLCRDAAVAQLEGIRNVPEAGPREFLGFFADAAFVVTNSFHGSVFSILFEKPFFSVIPHGMNNSGRQRSLLKTLGLLPCLLPAQEIETFREYPDIDYSLVRSELEKARAESETFLSNAMEGKG